MTYTFPSAIANFRTAVLDSCSFHKHTSWYRPIPVSGFNLFSFIKCNRSPPLLTTKGILDFQPNRLRFTLVDALISLSKEPELFLEIFPIVIGPSKLLAVVFGEGG